MNEERLKELEAFKAKLEIQLNETVFLIQGYKNAMENQQDDVPEQVEGVWPKQKEKAKRPERENGYA
jgi:hypothetical protein